MKRLIASLRGRGHDPSGFTCRQVVELVTDYFEDALPTSDRARFEAHVAQCDGCTAYVEQMRETVVLIGSIEPEALRPEVERELLTAFRAWTSGGGQA